MRPLLPVVMCALFALSSCQSRTHRVSEAPVDLSSRGARLQARKDFAAGAPVVYRAGSYGTYEPGIAESQKPLVAGLGRNYSLAGCTNPLVTRSDRFATAYNQELIRLLQAKTPP